MGITWSSARGVSCTLKWDNERNPHRMLNIHMEQPRRLLGRKARMTSSQHGSYTLGYTHPTMAKNNELQTSDSKLISEISPQFRLQAATCLHEVGIASNRGSACRGEYVLRSCTHRPSRQESWGHLNSDLSEEGETSDQA